MVHEMNGARRNISPITADVIILGAGPAGLTAAYELSSKGVSCIVIERDSVVGGLAKTVEYKGHLFDLGGHRFYTKVALIERLWHDILGADFLARPRLSRIYYRLRFFDYPLDPLNVVRGLGLFEILLCGLSFLRSHMFPQKPETNLARWVSNRFGRRLFKMFFESYTEKVWGIPCNELSADWAAQRIRGLSFSALIRHALNGHKAQNGKNPIKTLIREFHYPRRGPGMMWGRIQEILEQRGSQVILNTPVEKILWKEGHITGVEAGGVLYTGKHFINSLAIRDFFKMMDPAPPEPVIKTARDLHYRDFITVGLIVRGTNLFPDNWIYVHEPAVQVGRIQNYSNWSREMSPTPDTTSSLGMEYFCFENDALWSASDDELLGLARRELASLGLVKSADILDGKVIRVPKAYPVYDDSYRESIQVVREFVQTVPNLQLVGRNGMHRYNNQDHSMLTALMAARNVLGAHFDLWQMHRDTEYLEEGLALADEDILELEAEASFHTTANGGRIRTERKPPHAGTVGMPEAAHSRSSRKGRPA
jgi:protoporphyrinogen oxidase